MEFTHHGVIMRFPNIRIAEKVKRKLMFLDENVSFFIIHNEERLLSSKMWVPSNVRNEFDLNEFKKLRIDNNFRNKYTSSCLTCQFGSLWQFGFNDNYHCTHFRCSNPDCTSVINLPIIEQ
jgi:hypothetical protein